jgi:RNA polymerase-interacting CarD/CdnL/TRCF family regulator
VIAEQSYSERQLFEKAYERLKTELEIILGDKAKIKMYKALKLVENLTQTEIT